MAEIHWGSTLIPTKLELAAAWMGGQRWYAAKGATPSLRRLRSFRLEDPAGQVGMEVLILADDSGSAPVVYQVPFSYRGAPLEGAEHALVGTMDHSALGPRWVYDATHDPVFAERLVALIRGTDRAHASIKDVLHDDTIVGYPHPRWTSEPIVRSSTVLRGEQSNTSIMVDAVDDSGAPAPLMVKVFRVLSPGHNPDVEIQSALAEADCTRVPATVGHLSATWPTAHGAPVDNGESTAYATYDLAFAQELLPGVEDAWRVASRAVEEGTDFTTAASALGQATAEVHRALADALGTTPTTHETGSAIIDEMRARFVAAVAEVDALACFAPLVERVLTNASQVTWPPLQRIHGDYHLGQVLHSPERGWILLDFEGEPMRPLAERTLPDQWIRDVAGMLRSFDYCGGAWESDNAHDPRSPGSARAWVRAAQAAFLDGYAVSAGEDPRSRSALLTAFELDKAMYEVVYEARNRPDWVAIPLAAIDRLTSGVVEGSTAESDIERPTTQEEHP